MRNHGAWSLATSNPWPNQWPERVEHPCPTVAPTARRCWRAPLGPSGLPPGRPCANVGALSRPAFGPVRARPGIRGVGDQPAASGLRPAARTYYQERALAPKPPHWLEVPGRSARGAGCGGLRRRGPAAGLDARTSLGSQERVDIDDRAARVVCALLQHVLSGAAPTTEVARSALFALFGTPALGQSVWGALLVLPGVKACRVRASGTTKSSGLGGFP